MKTGSYESLSMWHSINHHRVMQNLTIDFFVQVQRDPWSQDASPGARRDTKGITRVAPASASSLLTSTLI